MAVYDWNKNGKKDVQDDYLEYNIYKNSSSGGGGDNSGCGCGLILAVLFILSLLGQCS